MQMCVRRRLAEVDLEKIKNYYAKKYNFINKRHYRLHQNQHLSHLLFGVLAVGGSARFVSYDISYFLKGFMINNKNGIIDEWILSWVRCDEFVCELRAVLVVCWLRHFWTIFISLVIEGSLLPMHCRSAWYSFYGMLAKKIPFAEDWKSSHWNLLFNSSIVCVIVVPLLRRNRQDHRHYQPWWMCLFLKNRLI